MLDIGAGLMLVSSAECFVESLKTRTTLDPGFRRDDSVEDNSSKNVIPTQTGIIMLRPTDLKTLFQRKPG
jgi:hypothetical protein